MSGASGRSRFAVLPIVCLAMLLQSVLRERGVSTASWPVWVLLVIAGGVLVAMVAVGWMAWRGARA